MWRTLKFCQEAQLS
uniref:Uncharacterized protein n=1 Tax=Arundo donax TaxID=35708 RepID=A0A0A8ZAH4_ARUDO